MRIKATIITLFMLDIFGMSSIMQVSASTLSMLQFDKTTMIKKKIADAQKYIIYEDYLAAQNTLNSLLKIDPNNSNAKELLEECEVGIKKQKQRIHQAYQDACKAGTISALQNFISKYPNSEYVSNAKIRIEDYSLWQKAKEQNTITAYNAYIQNSTIKAYIIDAQTAIEKIQEEQSWNKCKDSENEDLLVEFVGNYPESPNINEAKYRLNLLKGERMYKDGFAETAYLYFNSANSYRTLTGKAAVHYAELKDKNTFKEIQASSDIDKVRKYLNTLSFNSLYYNDTSNHLALLLGAKLNAWSSEYNMNEALSYAKDDYTRSTVKKYINQAKALHRAYERQRKARARKAWWKGRVSIGWNIANLGTNSFDSESSELALNHVGTGLRLRLGRYSDIINLIFGLDYQCYYFNNRSSSYYNRSFYSDYADDYNTNRYVHSVVAVGNLRFNLINLFSNAKLYIGCAGLFSLGEWGGDFPEESLNKNSVAIEPQIGGQGKKFDLGLYYRTFTDKGGPLEYKVTDNNHWGFYVTWYF